MLSLVPALRHISKTSLLEVRGNNTEITTTFINRNRQSMSKRPATTTLERSTSSPPAPAFCTRLTPDEAARQSAELTRLELSKLMASTTTSKTSTATSEALKQHSRSTLSSSAELGAALLPSTAARPTPPPSHDGEVGMHSMLLQYAEKYSVACEQLCALSAQMRDTHETILKMKDEQHELQASKEHFQGMAEECEEENRSLAQQLKDTEEGAQLASEVARDQLARRTTMVPVVLLLIVYTFFLLEMERMYSVNTYYTEYREML